MSKTVMFSLTLAMVFCLTPGLNAQEVQVPKELADSGLTVIVSDALIADQGVPKNSYWEPFVDISGDGTIIVISGVAGVDDGGNPMGETMNAMISILRPDSSEFQDFWAFYDDAGEPYTGNFNTKRPSGNPPRIAADRRPGETRYCVGQEATPWEFDEFTPDRWIDPFIFDERHATCQLFDLAADGPAPITNAFDSLYGGIVGEQNGGHMRFGGDIRFLSNGNLVICPEDRTGFTVAGTAAVARIYNGETGDPISDPFPGRMDGSAAGIWSNVAAFDGGFMIRNSGQLTTFDNDGNALMQLALSEVSLVADMGRGDDSRIGSDIGTQFVYVCGEDALGDLYLTKINALTGETVNEVLASEEFFIDLETDFRRSSCDCDANGNVVLSIAAYYYPGIEEPDGLCRIFDSDLNPVTDTFHTFTSHNTWDEGYLGFRQDESHCAMDTERIALAYNGEIAINEAGDLSPEESNFVTVLESPFKVSVSDWQIW